MISNLSMISKPSLSEYQGYFEQYVQLVPDADVLQVLQDQEQQVHDRMMGLTEEQAAHAYAAGKWTIKELLGHLADTERILAYRALCISRHEAQALPGFDEKAYVANANFNQRSVPNLLQDYHAVRQASLTLFRGFAPEMLIRTGNANGKFLSVRALVYIVAGHELHHLQILQTKYLV